MTFHYRPFCACLLNIQNIYDLLLPDSFVYTEADQKIEEGGGGGGASAKRRGTGSDI